MPVRTKRFVLSFLNKRNYSSAFRDEMLCDENTGEVLIKTINSGIVSFDANSRLTYHINTLYDKKELFDLGDMVYLITPDDYELPMSVTDNENMLDEPVSILGDIKKFTIAIDLDTIKVYPQHNANELITDSTGIKFVYTIYTTSSSRTMNVTTFAKLSSQTLLPLPDMGSAITHIDISEITVWNSEHNARHIVHSIPVIIGV